MSSCAQRVIEPRSGEVILSSLTQRNTTMTSLVIAEHDN
ncbi:MAG: hypothetical protein RJA36_1582, partial [Pseudomonadota bacterium]